MLLKSELKLSEYLYMQRSHDPSSKQASPVEVAISWLSKMSVDNLQDTVIDKNKHTLCGLDYVKYEKN